MTRSTHCACTSILVGKTASLDGSTMIARTENNACACAPKRFTVVPERRWEHKQFTSAGNGFSMELDGAALRYTSTPEGDPSEGLYEEAGINAAGVAMSATESTYANERVLALDPVTLRRGATLGPNSVVLPAAVLGRHATIGPASLVMRGESVPNRTRWVGNPIGPWTASAESM